MSTGKKMTREEIQHGLEAYQQRRRKMSGWPDWINPDAVLPLPDPSDPWGAILEREKSGQTLQ